MSAMTNHLADVDPSHYLHVPGVKLPEQGTPDWKVHKLKEKNLKLIHEYILSCKQREEDERREAEKWVDVPDWKRSILVQKEKKKQEKTREEEEALKRQQEAERLQQEKFESLPPWRKEKLRKKQSSGGDSRSESSAHETSSVTSCSENGDITP